MWSGIRGALDSNYQTYLDEYMDGEVEAKEEHVVDSGEGAPIGNVEFEGCEYCRLMGRGKFKLHPGSLFIYFKDGRLKVLADICLLYTSDAADE